MVLFILKERTLWGIRCHEEQLSCQRALGKELQDGRDNLDVRNTYGPEFICD